MSPRPAVAIVGCMLVAIAGCASIPPATEPTPTTDSAEPTGGPDSVTTTPTPSPSPTAAPCSVDPQIEDRSTAPDAKPYPDAQPTLNRSSVRNYTVRFEKALKWNLESADHNVSEIQWGFGMVDVTDHSNGTWEVELDVSAGVFYGPEYNHEDQRYLVTYVVSTERVRRAATTDREQPDAWRGTTVACP